jgi:serine/threonine protein kinase/Tol biopolymer transport system component
VSDGERWKRVKAIFNTVVARGAEDHEALVRKRCGDDRALQADVESLLAADRDRGSLLEQPISPALRGLALAAVADGREDTTQSLAAGTQLGTYTISGLLGAGGMGEVYRAHDNTLDREVAIKILPAHWMEASAHRGRVEREARLLAALNHPHIGAIYGIAESGGIRGLVLELVDGETLAERIDRRASRSRGLRLKEALNIALQIAEALEAAHGRGVIHRDLKPNNIKITADGRVKVLDFGVATFAGGSAPALPLTNSTSAPDTATREDALFGTAPYMSPEQARGEAVDSRTDVWAFGCILYEMLTGERAFDGDDATETLSRIVHQDPDLSRVPPGVSSVIGRLMALCLEKDRTQRLSQMAIARFQIADALADPPAKADGITGHRQSRPVLQALVLGVILGALVGLTVASFSMSPKASDASPLTRLLVGVAPAEQIGGTEGRPTRTALAISPDGMVLVFSAVRGNQRALYMRRLDQADAVPIPGTDGAENPFFSPDGQWIGYWADGEIHKAPLSGGPPLRVTAAALAFGASWGDDDRIVFSGGAGLFEVPASGGTATALTVLDEAQGELSHRLPHALPGGEAVLFTITKNRFPRWDETQIAVLSRRTGVSRVLVDGGADARYASTGHLIYVREGLLLAAPFDPRRLELTGGPVGLAADVMQAAYFRTQRDDAGAAQFTISATGTLVYVHGGTTPSVERTVVRVDRTGRSETLPLAPRPFVTLRLSPDGEQIALSTFGRDRDIWVYVPKRQTVSRLSVPGRNGVPIWTPDGQRITYATGASGRDGIHSVRADSIDSPEPLVGGEQDLVPAAWTPDARQLLYYQVSGPPSATWVYDRETKVPPVALASTADSSTVGGADVSPDGRWIAYHSDESGRFQVYVQGYPAGAPRYQISSDGGISPIWRTDSQELFYVRQNLASARSGPEEASIMAVSIAMQPVFTFGVATELFRGRYEMNRPARAYDVSADGRQFLLIQSRERAPELITQMNVVQNWFEELKRRVPRK